MRVSTSNQLDDYRRLIDQGLADLSLPRDPRGLYEPIRYILEGEGKRLRPILLFLAASVFDIPARRALPAGLSVEVFHNATLIHDDIMDHADERRGKATIHRRWDEPTAILAGDLMIGIAFDLIATAGRARAAEFVGVFQRMVSRLCEGQTLDMSFETRMQIGLDEYLEMIASKTGALIEASLELGGMLGEATDDQRGLLRTAGAHLGRAFQIQDDLLDLTADGESWGKPVGGDLIQGKKTYLLLLALERSTGDERAWFGRIVENGGLPMDGIEEAHRRMERLGVFEEARDAVITAYEAGREALVRLPAGRGRDGLFEIIERMSARVR